eukprot:m.335499 g.335499  ORF g.335499 m.335499 type:complete len:276 (+) comp17613_c0_seq1:98-925(+)
MWVYSAAILLAVASVGAEEQILSISPKEFDDFIVNVKENASNWFLMLDTEWCERGAEAASPFEDVLTTLEEEGTKSRQKGTVTRLGVVDCGWYPQMCAQLGHGSYPSFVLITRKAGDTAKDVRLYDYLGNREDSSEMVEFVISKGAGFAQVPRVVGVVSPVPERFMQHLFNVFETMLLSLERFIDTVHVTENPLVNAVIVGTLMGGLLVLPLLISSFLFSPLPAPPPPQIKEKLSPKKATKPKEPKPLTPQIGGDVGKTESKTQGIRRRLPDTDE